MNFSMNWGLINYFTVILLFTPNRHFSLKIPISLNGKKKKLSFMIRVCLKFIKPWTDPQITLCAVFSKYKRTWWSGEVYVTSGSKGRDRKEHEVEKQNNVKAIACRNWAKKKIFFHFYYLA